MRIQDIIIVLGAPNSSTGELSSIAQSRLNHCVSIYETGMFVVCTGGWGEQFNTTKTAHADYAKNYLIKKGIPVDSFLDGVYSANSVDDAVKTKQVINGIDAKLMIITSDYHLERIKLIFNKVLSTYACSYIGVKTDLVDAELDKLIEHEKQAVTSILNNGLYY